MLSQNDGKKKLEEKTSYLYTEYKNTRVKVS